MGVLRGRPLTEGEQEWGPGLIGRTFACLPLLGLAAFLLIDRSWTIGDIWPVPLVLGAFTVMSFRPLVRITQDELVIRHPIGSQRISRSHVASARFIYSGLVISKRDGGTAFAFIGPRLTSTELSGDKPPPDSAAFQITRWAQGVGSGPLPGR